MIQPGNVNYTAGQMANGGIPSNGSAMQSFSGNGSVGFGVQGPQ